MNRKEYNSAVQEHSGRLFGYCFKFLQNREDADDIVQDAFKKLWENRKKVEFTKSKSWLFTTAHNAMINFKVKQSRMVSMEILPETSSKAYFVKRLETKEIIEKALKNLPPLQKSIVLMRDLEGYNYQEIGDVLNLSESQVKVYLFRARKKLKKQLKDLTELVA
ncbi:MAG: RNA polymerase sigma factor [Crocinitomicaceae bacterium]|nr:RNA polymerase sigma factor [Crocinitomicaceae bacterium]